jgi:hypothetical protein
VKHKDAVARGNLTLIVLRSATSLTFIVGVSISEVINPTMLVAQKSNLRFNLSKSLEE